MTKLKRSELAYLAEVPGFWYVASPYSKYPGGMKEAWIEVCKAAGFLIRQKVPVFCPIAHTHPIAIHAHMDQLKHEIWLPADQPMLEAAYGMIIVMLETWETSTGIRYEQDYFKKASKPIWYMEWPQ